MADPTYMSAAGADSGALEAGTRLLMLADRGRGILDQQRNVAAVLDAHHTTTAIELPRRSTKSYSVLAWAVGMCALRPTIQIAYTAATTGKAARDRFTKELADPLSIGQHSAGLRVRRAGGTERIVWRNGSLLQIVAPKESEFRSQDYDVVIVDEAMGRSGAESDELIAAILPTLDTSPLGMLVLAGTAGRQREGNPLWDALEAGRRGDGGILEYAVPAEPAVEDLRDWSIVAELLRRHHPGVGTLTTLDRLKRNYDLMDSQLFAAEYLGVWGRAGHGAGIIGATEWAALYLEGDLPIPPKRFALALQVSPNQSHAAIVAAWREDGEGRLLVLGHRDGVAWAPVVARDLARRYRLPVVMDPFGAASGDVYRRLGELRPAPRLEPQSTGEVASAHARLLDEIRAGRVRHWGQQALTDAALSVRKRTMGESWRFGRAGEDDDVTALQAGALALRFYDAMPSAVRERIVA